MELHQTFTIRGEIDQAWAILQDLERIAPCLPGAEIDHVEGDWYAGSMKVRLGPITIRYEGKARIAELDEPAHSAVLVASGSEASGGTARATVTAKLTPGDAGTSVTVDTDLTVTGKPGQFGRGVLGDVAEQLLGQFAGCLSEELARPDQAAAAVQGNVDGAAGTATPSLAARDRDEAIDDVLHLIPGAAGREITIAVAAAAAGALVVWFVLRRTR